MKKAKLGESAFNMVITMTEMFDENVRHTYQKTAETIYGSPNTPGLATFAYGSPGRIELIGGDSDADILLVEEKVTEETRRFRKLFKERLSKFNFSKVDITGWGSYDDLDVYLGKSLVEGNQILESRFLIGDENVRETVEQKKRDYNSIERELKILSWRFKRISICLLARLSRQNVFRRTRRPNIPTKNKSWFRKTT